MSSIIIALDFANPKDATEFTEKMANTHCRFKIGNELFTRAGPRFIENLHKQGFEVFLDLKYHDIPNTVARACQAAADLGVWMLNVHALGGRTMLLAAREALNHYPRPPLLIAVSILTSLDEEDLYAVGLHGNLEENVLRLARLVQACGLDGLVCSPLEIQNIRAEVGKELTLVTPGIRLERLPQDDQKRIMTPIDAWRAGADYLVIGRPITTAKDPVQVFLDIEHSKTTLN